MPSKFKRPLNLESINADWEFLSSIFVTRSIRLGSPSASSLRLRHSEPLPLFLKIRFSFPFLSYIHTQELNSRKRCSGVLLSGGGSDRSLESMADHEGENEKHESAAESIIDKITDKFHGSDSSSDSEDDKIKSAAAAVKAKIYRLFGREKPVHKVLGGGKRTIVVFWISVYF